MENSLILSFFKRIISNLVKYYDYSLTKKYINNFFVKIRLCFDGSIILNSIVKKDNSLETKRKSILIEASESTINFVVNRFNNLFRKGFKGSFVIKLYNNIEKSMKDNICSFIIYAMISAVLFYDIYSLAIGNFSTKKIIVTLLVAALFLLNLYTDILNAFQESFIKKSLVKIFEFNLEE